MEIITALGQLHRASTPCVVALGTFDGLHRGHLDVILAAKREAERTGAQLAVFTFSNHPYACFRPDKVPPALITPAQKRALLAQLGVDILVDVPFDMSIARLEPETFLQRLQGLGYSCLVVGSNFTYGIRGGGNVHTLAESAAKFSFKLIVRELLCTDSVPGADSADGTNRMSSTDGVDSKDSADAEANAGAGAVAVISSTAIRQLIAEGKVDAAAAMLGRAYALSGIVAHGNERGRLLGYPTANLELADSKVAVPKEGVYAVRVLLGGAGAEVGSGSGKIYGGMANVGKNPTFGDVEKLRLETHLFAFSGDIYGQEVTIEFVQRIRDEVKFSSLDELKAALARDAGACKEIL